MYSFPSNCQIPSLSFVYETVFDDKKGLFIEVGAYNGQDFSNTSGLADKGWKGIYIEPNPSMMDLCKSRHKNNDCQFIQKAVGLGNGEVNLRLGGTLSTFNQEHFDIYKKMDWSKNELTDKEITVELITLNEIFKENGLETCEVLVIDVEGSEMDVMEGFDLEKYKPKMIIIELVDQHPDIIKLLSPESKQSFKALRERFGCLYNVLYKDTINTVFLRRDD